MIRRNFDDGPGVAVVDPRLVAFDEAIERIERELEVHLDPVRRVAVAIVLEALVDAAAFRRRKNQ